MLYLWLLTWIFPFAFPCEKQELTLLFAGDAMQHQSQLTQAFRNTGYDYSACFDEISAVVSAADLAIVNLETTLGDKPYKGYPMFSSPDAFAQALQTAGFDVFLNANNHILDRYGKGVHRTLDVLDSMQVWHTGVFRTVEERAEHYPLLIEKNRMRIAFLNYTYGTNGIQPPASLVVNYIDTAQIAFDIDRAQQLNADFIIANMHWGDEYQLSPNTTQTKTAEWLLRKGVDIVMGNHPHVIQPIETVVDSAGQITNIVVYSLGNFISGMTAVNTDGGQMIKIRLCKHFHHKYIAECKAELIYTDRRPDFVVIPVSTDKTYDSFKINRFVSNAARVWQKNMQIAKKF